ncbi:MAG: glycerol-3-phosphate 1-O-acyltransferase PlsY [Candidatus Bipolaricaulota bacterium]|nr:glycerol-3-phosphate 1-O-acyltransferase PlsY [Candidatus Bipolaricaulota bacterium]
MNLALLLIISYLLGAIPTSVIVGKVVCGIDVRDHGSGNAGATNTWRVLGWKAGVTVLALDAGKGAAAAALVPLIHFGHLPFTAPVIAILCGLSAVIGHVFPVYVGFRGGKGVATGAGMLIAVAPIPVGLAIGIFGLSMFLFGMVSLASILAVMSAPISIILLNRFSGTSYHPLLLGITCVLALFIIFNHRANIVRIIRGRERSLPRVQLWRRILHR